jgi:hypothetical protein
VRSKASGQRSRLVRRRPQTAAVTPPPTPDPAASADDPLPKVDAAIASGDFAGARQNLDKAARQIHASGAKNASLDYSYAQLYDKTAARTQAPAAKRKLLLQAGEAYRRFANTGAGPRVQRANDRLTEIADELKELGPP